MVATPKNKNYIMFQNVGEADLNALYFVGFSDKRNDPDTIGQFGSGFKLALTAAKRQGIEILILIGDVKISFVTKTQSVKGNQVEQLVFVVESPGKEPIERETSLTLDYGARDWKDAWGIFREMLANCIDADPHAYEVVAGIEPRGREGFTRIFIEATEEILDIYRDLDYYYKPARSALFTCELGRIYPKCSEEGTTRFFCKGMHVLQTADHGLYDIDLYNLPLTESRNASTDLLLNYVLQLFDQSPPDFKTEIIQSAIEQWNSGANTLENSLSWSRTRRPRAWVEAFRRAFPDHVVCSFSDMEFQGVVRLGRKAIRVPRELYRLLAGQGVPTAKQVLQEEEEGQREVFHPDGALKDNYNHAFERIAQRLPELHQLNISFVKMPPADKNISFVVCSRSRGEYQFSETLLRSGARAIAYSLIDALAQTKSVSGKCDLDYEKELIRMVQDCVEV